MATRQREEMIELALIANKFDVRTQLDQDRVVQLAGCYEGGVELPPIKIVALGENTDDVHYAFIDGRHRAAARAYLGLPDVPAVVCNGSLRDNPLELFAEALEANWGGAKPPTRQDIVHTIIRMLEHGASRTAIKERLTFLPPGAMRAYIADAFSTVSRRKLARALDGLGEDGLTIEEVAKKYGVKLDTLKEALKGQKRKWGTNRTNEVEFCTAMRRYVSVQLHTANRGISKKLTFLLQKVEDGEVSPKQAMSVIKAWKEHLRQTGLRVDDWTQRLESVAESQNRAAGVAS